jgi:hypothetical protein
MHLPIQFIRIVQLAEIERARLSDEFDVACAHASIVEVDEYHIRKVHAADLEI